MARSETNSAGLKIEIGGRYSIGYGDEFIVEGFDAVFLDVDVDSPARARRTIIAYGKTIHADRHVSPRTWTRLDEIR